MGDRGTEEPSERLVTLPVQVVLATEEDHLVLKCRGAHGCHDGGFEIAAESDAGHDGSDTPADPLDGDGAGGDGGGVGSRVDDGRGGHGGALSVRKWCVWE
ncbi:hypothetical protein [Streptomyces sp900116325]|uniref:hypothetical protein n=1 Tax=Streptomyces sp. 900116325 TaxID=3154295 RepID=UPI0033ABAA27